MSIAQVNIDHVWAHIATPLSSDVLQYIDSKTKYHPDGYDKTWVYNHRDGAGNRRWDGYNHTFNMAQQTFRRGLLKRITNCLEFHGHTVQVAECGPLEIQAALRAQMVSGSLRPLEYQGKVRQIVRQHKLGVIASPTGTGKSVMMGIICDELKERTLIVLNDLVLLDQMERNLLRYFPQGDIGYIGNTEFRLGEITVATLQSLRSILGIIEHKKKSPPPSPNRADLTGWLRGVGVVLHDEVHLADSESCIAVYDLLTGSPRRYGFSATPYGWAEKQQKTGNIELEQLFGHIIYSTFDLDFIALGMKVPLVVRNVQVPAMLDVYGTFRDNQAKLYAKCKKYEVTDNDQWANAIADTTREYTENGATAFVYAAHSLEYGHKVAKLLEAPFVNGKTTRKERFRLFDAVQAKELPCIVSDIGGIGLDIPSLNALILASDVKDVRQLMGRVERSSPGKLDGHFVDHWKDTSFMRKHHELRMTQYTQADATVI